MILTVDKTPVSPTTDSSEGFIGYRVLGPRPECVDCDSIDECPECAVDLAFKWPVVSGEKIYFQFNLADNYNSDIEEPAFGWYEGDGPSDPDYYMKATLQFQTADDLVLTTQDIIASASVGYYNGSYQNLILESAFILAYINAEGFASDCFRILITSYKRELPRFTLIQGFVVSTPVNVAAEGTIVVLTTGADQYLKVVNGQWVSTGQAQANDIVLLSKSGVYYQYVGGIWVEYDPSSTDEIDTTCFTAWHKFVNCEPTVLIEGVHGNNDCRGHYYGLPDDAPGGTLAYRDKYRIWASHEPTTIKLETEESENGNTISFEQRQVYLLRIDRPGMPWTAIKRLANSVAAQNFYCENILFINVGEIAKNNETSLHWYSQITMERISCEKENDCDELVIGTEFLPCEEVTCADANVCDVATVENSDATFTQEVDCGTTLVLEDITFEIYLDGLLNDTITFPSMVDQTINIEY